MQIAMMFSTIITYFCSSSHPHDCLLLLFYKCGIQWVKIVHASNRRHCKEEYLTFFRCDMMGELKLNFHFAIWINAWAYKIMHVAWIIQQISSLPSHLTHPPLPSASIIRSIYQCLQNLIYRNNKKKRVEIHTTYSYSFSFSFPFSLKSQ